VVKQIWFWHTQRMPEPARVELQEGPQLQALWGRLVLLASGEGDYEDPGQSWRIANVLGSKGIPNRVDLWGPDRHHDWKTWREMLPKYLAERT
jgi:esterase/lipase superfamily enzyme